MRLDHISYVTTHDQLIDEVQRIGARLGSGFSDGGIHPRFGTRNFTIPLLGGQYLEIVCPLDHPAADSSPFGQAVTQRANEGGGWLTWVISVDEINAVESRLGRDSVIGNRRKPDGTELSWKQIGVLATLSDRQLPFFIEWLSNNHPASENHPSAKIIKLEISGNKEKIENWIDDDISTTTADIEIEWSSPNNLDKLSGLTAVHFSTPTGPFRLE
jgi:hypothetical protein